MAKVLTSWRRGPLSSFSRRPRQFAAGDNAVNTMDLLQFTGTDLIGGMLNEVFRLVPEYSGENPIFGNRISVPGRNVSGKRYETLVRTEVPRGDHFRRFNEPSGNKKAKRQKREFEMFPFFDYWEADEQMMEIAPDGGAALMRDDAQAVLEGLVMDLGEYFYYGQSDEEDDDRVFPGIIKQMPDDRTHDLGGTGDHLTSIYFLWLDPGLNGVCWLHGAGGSIKTSPMKSRTRDMDDGKIDIVEQSIQGWFGLQVKHSKSVFRIENVDISSALTETPDPAIVNDELLRFAKSQFPTHMIPNLYMFMRPEVFTLWRSTKAPLITSVDGKLWTASKSGRTEDFYGGYYYDGLYLVAGKNGVLISSENPAKGWTSPYPTNITSIIRCVFRHNGVYILCTDAGQIAACATFAEILGMIFETDTLAPYNDLPLPLQAYADPGMSNRYARGDHVHSWEGLVTVAMVGVPGGVASLDTTGRIPAAQQTWPRGEPDGVAPLDENGLVPKRHLPPFDVNVVIEAMKNNLEFVEMQSCFKRGPGVSSILHDAAAAFDVVVMVGEAGIGYSRDVLNWEMVEVQPFANDRPSGSDPVIGVAAGTDADGDEVLVAIDTHRSFSVSRNGVDWSQRITLDGDYDFSGIAFYNRTFVIACGNGPVLRSVWTGDTLGFVEQEDGPEFTRGMTRLCGGNGLFVGVGDGGKIWTSDDASHFEPLESPTTKNLYVVAHGKATYVAAGEEGELIVGDGSEFKAGVKPFKGNADIMGLAYIESIGTFVATNRVGEIAITTDLETWVSIPSTSSTAQRAITSGLDCIILGNDLGEIAASRKVFEFSDVIGDGGGRGGNVSITRIISRDENNRATVRLIGRDGTATGKTIQNAILLNPGSATIQSITIEI